MYERVKTINKYYIDLGYCRQNNKKKALMRIPTLYKEIEFNVDKDMTERFLKTASIMKKNLFLFQSVCNHVDIIDTIIAYLNYFGQLYAQNIFEIKEICSVMYTLFTICPEPEVQLFLEIGIIKNSRIDLLSYTLTKMLLPYQTIEMILLEDSDLYAIISHLMVTEEYYVKKILVQQPIIQKFLLLIKKYIKHVNFSIHVFRSKEELLPDNTDLNMNIVSIWSEDVVAAKNLATFLNKDVIFINTHMDFYGSNMTLSYKKIFDNLLCYNIVEDKNAISIIKSISTIKTNINDSNYNIFCDNMWQKSIDICWMLNDSIQANAIIYDLKKCFKLAKSGYKIWSMWSIDSRMRVLSKFALILKYKGKFELSNIVLKWLKLPHLYETISSSVQSGRLEIIISYQPKGIIILHDENETILFRLLTQVLITGNSVIVLCTKNSYDLRPYCDMFSTSEIPPGVINVLLMQDSKQLSIPVTNFTNYEPQKAFLSLFNPKEIILALE